MKVVVEQIHGGDVVVTVDGPGDTGHLIFSKPQQLHDWLDAYFWGGHCGRAAGESGAEATKYPGNFA